MASCSYLLAEIVAATIPTTSILLPQTALAPLDKTPPCAPGRFS